MWCLPSCSNFLLLLLSLSFLLACCFCWDCASLRLYTLYCCISNLINKIMNAPERAAAFLLDEDNGEVKIVYTADTKVANAGQFRVNKEDHTVCNLLRMQLLRDPSVRFAGYFHPHPLVNFYNLKIQTNNSTVAPVEVLSSAIEDLANETDHLITQMVEAMDTWKRENDAEF